MQIAQVLLMSAARNPLNVCPYWVGDILTTMSEIQPAQRLPGTTWTQIKDMFILAAGDIYQLNATGGEATHKLNTKEMPGHTHYYRSPAGTAGAPSVSFGEYAFGGPFNGPGKTWWQYDEAATTLGYNGTWVGGDQPHNNMPLT